MSDSAVLSAQAAIREVLVNYCRGMDRIDVPLARATWHPAAGVAMRALRAPSRAPPKNVAIGRPASTVGSFPTRTKSRTA
jgi:hypothetical protein